MTASTAYADWIAVDWGTSNLRAWAMRADGTVLDEAASEDGMGALNPDQFEPALLRLIDRWLGVGPTPVMACGMVGSRQGMCEAPYVEVPAQPRNLDPVLVPNTDPRISIRIVPGLKQVSPPDVMRGEETQIAGFIAENPKFDGILCLPGTHTKWVEISAGEVVSFRTFMTGELYTLLGEQSVLQHALEGGWDVSAFGDAVNETLSKPENLAARLFSIRADHLLNATDGATAKSRLSGYLIGAELAAARPYWLGQEIAIIGSEDMISVYSEALKLQGLMPKTVVSDHVTRAGLRALSQSWSEAAE